MKMFFAMVSSIFASVLDACFKCFICLQMYVARVASECFKTKSGVAHVAMRVRSTCQCGPVWACETQAWAGACWDEHRPGVQARGKQSAAWALGRGRPSKR